MGLARRVVNVVPFGIEAVPGSIGFLIIPGQNGAADRFFKVEYKSSDDKTIPITSQLAWSKIQNSSIALLSLALGHAEPNVNFFESPIEISLKKQEFSIHTLNPDRVTKISIPNDEIKRIESTFKDLSNNLSALYKNPKIFEESASLTSFNDFKTTRHVRFFAQNPLLPNTDLDRDWIHRQLLVGIDTVKTQDDLDKIVDRVKGTPIAVAEELHVDQAAIGGFHFPDQNKFLLTIDNKAYIIRKEGDRFILLNPNEEETSERQKTYPYLTTPLSADDLTTFIRSRGAANFTFSWITPQ